MPQDYSANLTRRVFRLRAESGKVRLERAEEPVPALEPREVLLRVEAASLNYRDLLILQGAFGTAKDGLIPLSDGAGRIAAVGSEVKRWRVAERAATLFFPSWREGRYSQAFGETALGGGRTDGVLSDFIVAHEDALIGAPESLTIEEAATLPCAGVTVWHAFSRAKLDAGDTLLTQGAGGVALFGLQFAKAFGAKTIVISSSDKKLERAKKLGAWATINYRTSPDWDVEIQKLTQGRGVDHILELGGPGTFDRSLRALAPGGHIAQIGVLTGYGPQSNLMRLQAINANIHGVSVGSAEHFEAMNAFIDAHKIKPHIDEVFAFDDAPQAYEALARAGHFGKLVIKF